MKLVHCLLLIVFTSRLGYADPSGLTGGDTVKENLTDTKAEDILIAIPSFIKAGHITVFMAPLAGYLSDNLPHKVQFRAPYSYSLLLQGLLAGEYQLAFLPPHLAFHQIDKNGFTPIVKTARNASIVIVTSDRSGINSLSQLRQGTLAVESYFSLAYQDVVSHLYTTSPELLPQLQIKEMTKENMILAVLNRRVTAAAIGKHEMNLIVENVRRELRVIYSGELWPGWIIIASPEASPALTSRLQALMLDFEYLERGNTFVESTGIGGYEVVMPSDLSRLRKLEAWFDEKQIEPVEK